MLRLKTHKSQRIPNRLAVLASLMLLVSALAGAGSAMNSQSVEPDSMAGAPTEVSDQAASNDFSQRRAKRARGFKVSLFLFRLN